jgi:hypothetical protein
VHGHQLRLRPALAPVHGAREHLERGFRGLADVPHLPALVPFHVLGVPLTSAPSIASPLLQLLVQVAHVLLSLHSEGRASPGTNNGCWGSPPVGVN